MKDYWKVSELAQRWRVTPRTIYRMLQRGELHGIYIAGARLIADEERRRVEEEAAGRSKPAPARS